MYWQNEAIPEYMRDAVKQLVNNKKKLGDTPIGRWLDFFSAPKYIAYEARFVWDENGTK